MTNVVESRQPRNITRWGGSAASNERAECSAATLTLAQRDLARSGLTLEDAARIGIAPVDDASVEHPDYSPSPALMIPFFRPDGSVETYEREGVFAPYVVARYLVAPGTPLPKDGRKYDSPRNGGVHIHYPKTIDWAQLPEIRRCVIVEGPKKAEALAKHGIVACAISGVDNVRDTQTRALHPDLVTVAAQCDDIYIVFDSDIATNEHVAKAERRLATKLAFLKTRVHCVRIPPSDEHDPKGKPLKVGADDFLVVHGPDALSELILSTPALGEREAQRDDRGVYTIAELLAREARPVEELIDGLLEKGIPTFLCAPGGTHKSRLALQWGLAVNAGAHPFLGCLPGDKFGALPMPQATLVYLSSEDGEDELTRRAQAISRELKLPLPTTGLLWSRKGRESALAVMKEDGEMAFTDFYFELLERLRAIGRHKLIVLDSCYDYAKFVGKAKISEDATNGFVKIALQRLCDEADATLLVIWHPSQAGSSRDDMSGWSVAWHNAPRARIAIETEADKPDEIIVKTVKRNHSARGEPMKLRFHNGALLPAEAVPQAAHDAGLLRQAVVRCAIQAAQHGTPFNKKDRIPGWAMEDAQKATGRRPAQIAFKDELFAAVLAGELRFVESAKRRAAGFYPADESEALDLSRDAKRGIA
jgi:hypothetical protein